MPCIKKIEIFIDAIDWNTRIEGNNLTECRVSYQIGVLAFVAGIDLGTKLTAWEHNTPPEIKGIVTKDIQLKLLKAYL